MIQRLNKKICQVFVRLSVKIHSTIETSEKQQKKLYFSMLLWYLASVVSLKT